VSHATPSKNDLADMGSARVATGARAMTSANPFPRTGRIVRTAWTRGKSHARSIGWALGRDTVRKRPLIWPEQRLQRDPSEPAKCYGDAHRASLPMGRPDDDGGNGRDFIETWAERKARKAAERAAAARAAEAAARVAPARRKKRIRNRRTDFAKKDSRRCVSRGRG